MFGAEFIIGGIDLAQLSRSLYEQYLVPGEYLLALFREFAPALASAAGVGAPNSAPLTVLAVATLFWILALWAVRSLILLIRDIDRALTAWIVSCVRWLAWRIRVVSRNVVSAMRRIVGARAAEGSSVRNVEISTLEGALLRAQLRVVPGSVATARELAVDLAVSAAQAGRALERLSLLGLVESSAGAGTLGYRLTRLGRSFTEAHAARADGIAHG